MTLASLAYHAAAVLSMAAVAGWLLIRACNAWTRPDDALAGLMRLSHELHPLAYLRGLLADALRTLRERGKPTPRLSMRPEDLDYPQHDNEKGETE